MNFIKAPSLGRLMCSLVRQNFSENCEKAVNRQIEMELQASYDYLAMAYHFDRYEIALPGAYNFFKKASDEERSHAEMLMKYLNQRGGQIVLPKLNVPEKVYDNPLEAMHAALTMEKKVNESLLELTNLASDEKDHSLCDFIETHFLDEQVQAIKKLADLIRQLQRCEKEVGVYIFDKDLNDEKTH